MPDTKAPTSLTARFGAPRHVDLFSEKGLVHGVLVDERADDSERKEGDSLNRSGRHPANQIAYGPDGQRYYQNGHGHRNWPTYWP